MKGKTKFALEILLTFMVLVAKVSSASAAEVIVQNALDNRVNAAVLYFDRAAGLWTTRGWWGVNGNSSITITVKNVDASKGVYYAGMRGKALYYDSSTLNSDSANRWISDDSFWFNGATNDKPAGKNVRTVRFYKCRYSEDAGAYVIRIDTRPAG